MMNRISAVFLGVLVFFSNNIKADESQTQTIAIPQNNDLKEVRGLQSKDGWLLRLKSDFGVNYGHNSNVVGQTDGTTLLMDFGIDSGFDMKKGSHQWRTSLVISETFTRTPLIDEFMSSADTLKIDTMYLYYLVKIFGVYARTGADMPLFAHYDYQPSPVNYVITQIDGTINMRTAKKVQITEPLSPLNIYAGAGPFLRPFSRKYANAEIMLGLGMKKTVVDGGDLVVSDNADTPERELREMGDVMQVGGESIFKFWGELSDGRIIYSAQSVFLYPIYADPDPAKSSLSGIDIMNIDATAKIEFRLVSFIFLSYEIKAVRQPLLVDKWQIQNNIVLKISFAGEKFIESE
ncbi:MAG: hypothetical protein N3B13_06745 [Deltaproteobacteria bacterium]|nr:hypothetical protein [Deltaproteobacteria bacterium]